MKILNCFFICFIVSVQSQLEFNSFLSEDWLNFFTAAENKTIIDVAKALGANTLINLLNKSDLIARLSGEGPFTLFAPTDAAFEALPPEVVAYFKKHPKQLTNVLLYHVNPKNTSSKEFKNEQLLQTLLRKKEIRINVYPKNNISTATGNIISKPDQQASNGVVHLVDSVLFKIPAFNMIKVLDLVSDFWFLNAAIKMANLRKKLSGDGPFTLFAPPNSAFKKLPRSIIEQLLKNRTALAEVISYHVLLGTYFSAGLENGSIATAQGANINVTISDHKISINNASVVYSDFPVTNGVLYVIDEVLFPPESKFNIQMTPPFVTKSLPNDIFNFILSYDGVKNDDLKKFQTYL